MDCSGVSYNYESLPITCTPLDARIIKSRPNTQQTVTLSLKKPHRKHNKFIQKRQRFNYNTTHQYTTQEHNIQR